MRGHFPFHFTALACLAGLRTNAAQVWTFIMSDTSFRTTPSSHSGSYTPEVAAGKVKIVCVDAKLVDKDAGEQQ